MDFRLLVVLAPLALVVVWAFINMSKAVANGEASLFGSRGNKFW
ncbi:photosystem II protein Y [Pseudanabaena sp. PCC 6802]|nr:photosystem II protein Y [Pseudanabaena sp. PCC 6802]